MAVVTSSFFSLARTRKELEKAYKNEDWDTVRRLDVLLADMLNEAFDDEQRDTHALVNELQRVLKLYAKVVNALPETALNLVSPSRF